MVQIEFANPGKIYLQAYKEFFKKNHSQELYVFSLLAFTGLILLFLDFPVFTGGLLFLFGLTYISFLFIVYYLIPAKAIRKIRDAKVIINVSDQLITVTGDHIKIRYEWKKMKESFFMEDFILVLNSDDTLFVIPTLDLGSDNLKKITEFFKSKKVKMTTF